MNNIIGSIKPKQRPIVTFRSSQTFKDKLDQVVMETVINRSTNGKLYKYTRTDLILEAIKYCFGITDEDNK